MRESINRDRILAELARDQERLKHAPRCGQCGSTFGVRRAGDPCIYCRDIADSKAEEARLRELGALQTPPPLRQDPSTGALSADELGALSEPGGIQPLAPRPLQGLDACAVRGFLRDLYAQLECSLLQGVGSRELDQLARDVDRTARELAWVLGRHDRAPFLAGSEAHYLRRALVQEHPVYLDSEPGALRIFGDDEVEGCTQKALDGARNVSLATAIFLGALLVLYVLARAFGWEVPQ